MKWQQTIQRWDMAYCTPQNVKWLYLKFRLGRALAVVLGHAYMCKQAMIYHLSVGILNNWLFASYWWVINYLTQLYSKTFQLFLSATDKNHLETLSCKLESKTETMTKLPMHQIYRCRVLGWDSLLEDFTEDWRKCRKKLRKVCLQHYFIS